MKVVPLGRITVPIVKESFQEEGCLTWREKTELELSEGFWKRMGKLNLKYGVDMRISAS